MRRGLAILVVAFACGPSTPRAVENARRGGGLQLPSVDLSFTSSSPRPAIDLSQFLPDFHDELRWPLSGMMHPSREPRYDLADQLATSGIEWEELCARGVQNRVSATQRELLAYLRGWCFVAKRDVDSACGQLRALLGSTTRGLTLAVRHDLANILVEEGADRAEHWLTKHKIRDIQILDLLAANFIEVGSKQDAHAITLRAIESDDHATNATKCRRLVRRIVLAAEANPLVAMEQLKRLATPNESNIPDPVCERAYRKVMCAQQPATECMAYFVDEGISPLAAKLFATYYDWPYEADFERWDEVAASARAAMPLPGAVELLVTALEASLRALRSCSSNRAALVHYSVEMVRRDPNNAAYEPRLEQLTATCPKPSETTQPSAPSAPAATPQTTSTTTSVTPPPVATPPAASWPPSVPPGCDAAALKREGDTHVDAGAYTRALASYEASLACFPNEDLLQRVFILSCRTKSSDKAKYYFKQLDAADRERFAEQCIRAGVAYE